MHFSGYIAGIAGVLAATVLTACSIKEDRSLYPCFLNISLSRQAEQTFSKDTAWCSVRKGEKILYEKIFSPVIGRDSVIICPVSRNQTLSVLVSNTEQGKDRITVPEGAQMSELYIYRKETNCIGEAAKVGFDSFNKKHINITFRLNEDAYPYWERLHLVVNGLYDGISLPSMKPHGGTFRCDAYFGEDGKTRICIPPQGGSGLKTEMLIDGKAPAKIDLYRIMLDAMFDWKDDSLEDFEVILGLNSVTGIIQVVDWNVVQLKNIKF